MPRANIDDPSRCAGANSDRLFTNHSLLRSVGFSAALSNEAITPSASCDDAYIIQLFRVGKLYC